MEMFITEKVKELWSVWDRQIYLLLSLTVQTSLQLLAPSRKLTTKRWVILLVWSGYQLANWVAFASLSLIFSSISLSSSLDAAGEISVLWATFVLLHLGGPDNLVSFSQEDNELWLRFLAGEVFAVGFTAYNCVRILPNSGLWWPTFFLFIAGFMKYSERARALYLASADHFRDHLHPRPNPGPQYETLSKIFAWMRKAGLPLHQESFEVPYKKVEAYDSNPSQQPLDDAHTLFRYAYHFFEVFKGILVDVVPGSRSRQESREFFLRRKAIDAFRLIEIELSYMHDVLHTKARVMRGKKFCFLVLVRMSCVIVALLIFIPMDKQTFDGSNLKVTYALFANTMMQDALSLLMLVFSDWNAGTLRNRFGRFISSVQIQKCRWSNSMITQCNLIDYSLVKPPVKSFDAIDKFLIYMRVRSCKRISEKLKEFIFMELLQKSKIADNIETAAEICSYRGEWVLSASRLYAELRWSLSEVQYVESLLIWHLATQLCYLETEKSESSVDPARQFSKLLSDYMFYILLNQPAIVTQQSDGDWEALLENTSAYIKENFRGILKIPSKERSIVRALTVKMENKPKRVKGKVVKHVLSDAIYLANQLLKKDPMPWELMSRIWVELLSYAAINCGANVHAQQLSRGGELITTVWLMMTHLGLGNEFSKEEDVGKTKLIVGK